jgi:hypothetical protein
MSLKNKSLVGTGNTHMLMFVNIKDENSVTKKNIGNEKKKIMKTLSMEFVSLYKFVCLGMEPGFGLCLYGLMLIFCFFKFLSSLIPLC